MDRNLQDQVVARVWQGWSPEEIDLLALTSRTKVIKDIVDHPTRQPDAGLGTRYGGFVLKQERH